MPSVPSLLSGPRGSTPPVRAALFAAWFLVAGWLAWDHVLWRDEVRAFTLARSGETTADMLRVIHGEGHPALWYLLLRAAHALTGAKQALPVLGFAIAAAAAALFAARAPFRPAVLAAGLFGAFFVHEYAAVSRNYGIAMLLMFAFAALYPRWKERGVGSGAILALLANTNAPSVLLAGALALFWGVELVLTQGWRWTPAWRGWAIGVALLLVGVVACVAEVYPPANDAAVSPMAGRLSVGAVLAAALNITAPLSSLVPEGWWTVPIATLLLAAMIVGGPLGLLRSPGGLAASLAAMLALPLFFQIVYPGTYRHQALYVCLLLTLHWLTAAGQGGHWPERAPVVRPATQALTVRWGQALTIALLLAQVAITAEPVTAALRGEPYSRSREVADLLRRSGLGTAVVLADMDVPLEPLAYYADNPTWLLRTRRWGQVVPFSKANDIDLSLRDILRTARALRTRTGRPVVLLMQVGFDPGAKPQTWRQGYVGAVTTTPGDVRAFLAGTRRLARLGPAVTDETYDVYRLRDP